MKQYFTDANRVVITYQPEASKAPQNGNAQKGESQ